jgi:hypothetical protein
MKATLTTFDGDPFNDHTIQLLNPDYIFEQYMAAALKFAKDGDKVLVKVVLSDDTGFYIQFNREA